MKESYIENDSVYISYYNYAHSMGCKSNVGLSPKSRKVIRKSWNWNDKSYGPFKGGNGKL